MDASEIRRNRLQSWVDNQFGGKVIALVRNYELKESMASYLSQLLSGHRKFGERAARKLEEQCKRPPGWLDTEEQINEAAPAIRFDPELVAQLSTADRELIEDFIALVIQRNEISSLGRLRMNATEITEPSPKLKNANLKPSRKSYSSDEQTPPIKRRQHR